MRISPKPSLVLILIACLLLSSCRLNARADRESNPVITEPPAGQPSVPTGTPEPRLLALQYTIGRNDYIIQMDDTPRKVLVYVPAGYDANRATPVVIMYHGSNQGGPLMYENTQWAPLADQQNFIAVFPTSWKYKLAGEPGLQDKWNTANMSQLVEPGTELQDDVKFTRLILENLEATFNIDPTRIYATGFSNGASFVLTRLIPEMNDVFSAYSTSGSGLWGTESLKAIPTGITVPLYSVIGTNDDKISEGTGHPRPFPIKPDEIFSDPLFNTMLTNATTMLALEPSYQAHPEDESVVMVFDSSLLGADNQYTFRMVRGLFHVYSSGDNNRGNLDIAPVFWDFFMLYHK
jgi:predicted esterase